ncbi:MAG: hypothetical protein IMZ62_17340 [Chloroflexi bacterium]|nr:hypothetical protein [Chloroflexota bacterium]
MKRGTPTHPKMSRLAKALEIPLPYAVGILEMLWHFAAKYAIRGDVGRYSDAEIAEAVSWPGDPYLLISALVWARWLDVDPDYRLSIHHWKDHADSSVKKTLENRKETFINATFQNFPELSGTFQNFIACRCLSLALPLPEPMPEPEPEPTTSARTPTEASAPPITKTPKPTFDPEARRFIGFTDADKVTWKAAYPGIDITAEVHKAIAWLMADWPRRKKSQWRRFLTGWLSRAQDRHGGHAPPGQGTHTETATERANRQLQEAYGGKP